MEFEGEDAVFGDMLGGDSDHVGFCNDHPNRVIHHGSFGLKVHHYDSQDKKLRLHFSYDPEKEERIAAATQSAQCDRPRRNVSWFAAKYFQDFESSHIVLYNYDNELNIYGILTASETCDDDSAVTTHINNVKLYDEHFKLLCTVPVDIIHVKQRYEQDPNIGFEIDQDILIVTIRSQSKSALYVYQNREYWYK